jgi:hypothetical protein
MKHIKMFEDLNKEPEVGDYVLVRIDLKMYVLKDVVNNFINNNIGKIAYKYTENVKVVYDNPPPELEKWFGFNGARTFDMDRIVDFDKSKEKLKLRLAANKYNI